MAVLLVAKKDDAAPEIAAFLQGAAQFWSALFRVLRKSTRSICDEAGSESEKEKAKKLLFIDYAIALTANTLHSASFDRPRECEPLVRIWANENLLGAVEEIISKLVEITGTTCECPIQLFCRPCFMCVPSQCNSLEFLNSWSQLS